MSTLLKLKAKAASKRNEAQKIVEKVAAEPIVRDMNPDEKKAFDDLMAEVGTLKTQVAAIKAIEDDEAAADAEEVAADSAERSLRRGNQMGGPPAIHGEKRAYSINRALRLAAEGKPVDGLEGEVNAEITRQRGQAPKGFYLPTGANPEVRRAMYPGRDPDEHDRQIRRDLTTTTGVGSIFNLPELPLVELLRAQLVLRNLGATFLTDLKGTFSMMRQNQASQFYWVGEGNNTTASNEGYDQIPFTPKLGIAKVVVSRQFLMQTSLDAEAEVRKDLSQSAAREIDRVGINGSGSTQPLGLLKNSTILANSASLLHGANGGPFTYADSIAMESLVANYNADIGKLAYLFSPALRGALKQTPLIGSTFPNFVYGKGDVVGEGEVNNYRALATSLVPTNGTRGTGTNLKSAIFGNWSDLYIAQWEGMDVLTNPYTLQDSGGVIFSLNIGLDVEVRHPESFAVVIDAT